MELDIKLLIIVIIFLGGVLLFMNYIIWVKPDIFIRFLQRGKPQKENQLLRNKFIWDFIENPNYIWYARIVFLAMLLSVIYFIVAYWDFIR